MPITQPDKYFSHITRIDVRFDLVNIGLDKVLLDVDNTIRSRADRTVPGDVRAWMARCREAGVSFCLLSNNFHDDVYDLAEELGMPVVAKAMKPLAPAYLAAMRRLDAKSAETVVIGDQLVTDIVGARMLGLKAYLVAPLAEVDLPHTLALRRVEALLLGKRREDAPEWGEAYRGAEEDAGKEEPCAH